jgi:sugar phosphate isomerase/epimerase
MKNKWKRSITLTVLIVVSFCLTVIAEQDKAKSVQPGEIYKGWRVATQAWTFHTGTFFETVDNAHMLGLKYIEAYGNQPLSKEFPKETTGYSMSAETKQKIRAKLAEAGIKISSYGVVTPAQNTEAEWRKFFDFAKDMGIDTIVSEPSEDSFDMLDKLCQEYKINLAIHNHPKPSHYWNPDTVLKVCEGRSKYIGACADTGHWMRSDINPIEAIKKLKGRIIELHAKDLDKFSDPAAHDVVWGTGVGDFKGVLAELDKQGFKGLFVIEYEHNYGKSMPELAGCIANFNKFAAELSHAEWKDLLNKDLSNAIYKPGSWVFDADGVLTAKGGEGHGLDIWTKDRYGNFVLDLEFKVAPSTNSGVFLRTGNIQNWINTCMEVQIHENTDGTLHGQCGAIYDCLSPSKSALKKTGEWNRYVITCLDNKIYVELNGESIIDMDLNLWTEAHKNPDGSPNKFTTAYKDMPREGNLGLQYHGTPIWYKNLKIKPLD